ncbi:cytochrome P450 [Streptomyces sp. SID3343]|uniref:cytochrome P450 n=1 Tax=Streptomyces sp. SID3343 TaxID=2690260 RepID=UPI001367B779|nr:cytochrome P450 [Streptomyces sp. SID3343]
MTAHPQPPRSTATATRAARAPGGWPVVGHLPHLLRAPLSFLGSLPAHGDLVEIRLGPRPAFVLCHPELAKQVMADGRTFDRIGPLYEGSRAALGNGLATCPHADHRRQRLLMQPAFRAEHLAGYADVMRAGIATVVDRWQPGAVVDIVDEMFALTTTVAVRTLFGSDVDDHDIGELRDSLDTFLRGVYVRALLPAVDSVPTPNSRRYARALATWRTHVTRIVADRRAGGADQAERTDGHDLLSRLIAARDDDGGAMTERELHDQVAVLILAGAETTSSTLAWTLHLVANHPDAERALHAEVDAVLDGGIATLDDVPRLPWTTKVIRESLRLYPPAWVLPRTTTRDVDLAGRRVRAGSTIVFSPYILHRHPGFHDDPDRFRPERHSTGVGDSDRSAPDPWSRSSFVPFGSGPNKCIGDTFALTETTLALASIAARWRLRPADSRPVRPVPRSVLTPSRLRMRPTPRHAHPPAADA